MQNMDNILPDVKIVSELQPDTYIRKIQYNNNNKKKKTHIPY